MLIIKNIYKVSPYVILLLFFCVQLLVIDPASAKKSKQSQKGIVKVDGAAIYKKPDFDSAILDYLDKGLKVVLTRKTYKGKDGLGVFYKIRLGKKRYGYIVDTEVKPSLKLNVFKFKENKSFSKNNSKPEGARKAPIYFTKFIGGGINYVNFTEEYASVILSDFSTMFSLKMTGPGVLFDGPPIDLEINLSFQPPAYYSDLIGPTSGFYSLSSLSFVAPLHESSSSLLFYSLGIMGVYESFSVELVPGTPLEVEELRLGAVLGMGYAFYVGDFLLKFDAKYYYEQEKYIAGGVFLQKSY